MKFYTDIHSTPTMNVLDSWLMDLTLKVSIWQVGNETQKSIFLKKWTSDDFDSIVWIIQRR